MRFPKWLEWTWYLILLFAMTLVVTGDWRPYWIAKGNNHYQQYYTVFILWLILLLVPIFHEISIFGVSVKRKVEEIKKEIQTQRKDTRQYWLGNDLASLRFQALLFRPNKNVDLIEWQSIQALNHAKAAGVRTEIIEGISRAVQNYKESTDKEAADVFALEILTSMRHKY